MNLKKYANAMVGLLILQFMLGMLANFYSNIPSSKPYKVFDHFGFIAFHALNGLLLLILSIVFVVKSKKAGSYVDEIGKGLGTIISAFVFGELFVFTQKDIFSLLMALSFIGAMLNYAKIAFTAAESKPKKVTAGLQQQFII